MKFSTFIPLSLIAPAVAFRPELYTDENGERKLKAIPEHIFERGRELDEERRRLQNSDYEWTEKYCVTYQLKALGSEITASERNTTVGTTLAFPLYFAEQNITEGPIGYFSDATTNLAGTDECLFTGSFVFGPANEEGFWDDQVTLGGTCKGKENAITGGSGVFECAKGYEYFTDAVGGMDPDFLYFTAFYCTGCKF